jgi:hypothetical protein
MRGSGGGNEILLVQSPSVVSSEPGQRLLLRVPLTRRCWTSRHPSCAVAVQSAGAGEQAWTFVSMPRADASTVPALVVGSRVVVQGAEPYELYHLFPLSREEETLALVQRALLLAGVALVLLVGLIAFVVTRRQ